MPWCLSIEFFYLLLLYLSVLLLSAQDESFLGSYKRVLEERNFAVPDTDVEESNSATPDTDVKKRDSKDKKLFTKTDLQIVESAVVALVRRRVADDIDRLCCNDVNNLTVVDVDSYGFVTLVKCKGCKTKIETTCHDLNWTYEKISKLSQLKMGDHICWHRPLAYWHHAIVTDVNHDERTMQIIHYSGNMIVEETEKSEDEACKGWCNTLYHVNYHDCYNNEYTVLRATKLVNEDRYNLAERNCEHFSRWCKTGLTSSSIAWTSVGKDNDKKLFTEPKLQIVESAVVALVQRRVAHDIDRLCCNDVNNLTVVGLDVDSYGFVTLVKCAGCKMETETTCHDHNWTYEKISKLSQLKAGDHICWHRPLAYWHHAIVTDVRYLEMDIIHYSDNMRVEKEVKLEYEAFTGCCNTLYRVNYQECYSNEYTVLRARKLVNEERYNLIERNCEHFSRWCKTGLTSSSQIRFAWISAAKGLLTIGLRVLMLLILGLLQYSHESQEDKVRDRPYLEKVQKILLYVYIAVTTVVFVIYLLKTTGSHLARVRRRGRYDDAENPCCRPQKSKKCIKCIRCTCCIFCTCCTIIRRIVCCFCDNVKCDPCTCCRRPAHLACGLFFRIVVRELSAAACTLAIILNEEAITNRDNIIYLPPANRTALLVFFATLTQLGGYLVGALVGRWFEEFGSCCCECCCDFP